MLRGFLALCLSLAPALASAQDGAVAVLYFDNQGNTELEPLKVGLAQMLITDLQQAGDVQIVERARLQAILDELQLGHDGLADPATTARVGQLLGAQWLVLGSYFELRGNLRVDARLVRVETGEIVHSQGSMERSERFQEIEQDLARSLHQALLATRGAPATPPTPTTRGDSTRTPPAIVQPDRDQLAAAVAFSQGLIALDQQDTTRARESFQSAITSDPAFEDAKVQLASLEL